MGKRGFEGLAEHLRQQIDAHKIGVLPDIEQLMLEYDTTLPLASAALQQLAKDGLIRRIWIDDKLRWVPVWMKQSHAVAEWSLTEDMLAAITTGQWRTLPSTSELKRTFGASQSRVARAIATLYRRGLVERGYPLGASYACWVVTGTVPVYATVVEAKAARLGLMATRGNWPAGIGFDELKKVLNTSGEVLSSALRLLADEGVVRKIPRPDSTDQWVPSKVAGRLPNTRAEIDRDAVAKIKARIPATGPTLPSAPALAGELGLTIAATRRALESLTADGRLRRQRGPHGEYWTPAAVPRRLSAAEVAGEIATRMQSGEWSPLPDTATLIAHFRADYAKVIHPALEILEDRGLIAKLNLDRDQGGARWVHIGPDGPVRLPSKRYKSDDVADEIRTAIIDRRWAELPRLQALADEFDTTHPTVLKALRRLVADGIVIDRGRRHPRFVLAAD